MELRFAFLAEYADHTSEKNMIICGADIDRINCEGVPVIGRLALVAKFRVAPNEIDTTHNLKLKVTGPSGKTKTVLESLPVNKSRNVNHPDQPTGASVIVNMQFGLESVGEYVWHLYVNDDEVATFPLTVSLIKEGESL